MQCIISGFRREVGENSAFLGYCAGSSCNFLPTFRDNLLVPYFQFLTLEDGTDKLSRNVGKELPLLAK